MASSSVQKGIQISIDRGGTFTDIHAVIPGKQDIVLKVLSVDPGNYSDAPTEGIRRVLEIVTGKPHPRGKPLDTAGISRIRMGTTVGTNALLERKGAKSALLITKGFKDLLRIGNQSRPELFDLSVARPDLLYESAVEVDERVTLEGFAENPSPGPEIVDAVGDPSLVPGVTGEVVRIIKKPDLAALQAPLRKLWDNGVRSLSVVLLHSYVYPDHEREVGAFARQMGFSVVESAALQPMVKVVPRGISATADAYLSPIIKTYIRSIAANFKSGLSSDDGFRCDFMQSDGGLVDHREFGGLRSILSGPAGGVVGYAQTAWDADLRKPVIGFDMGGTSTDVSRYAGSYEHVFETTTAGVSVQTPQLDINTVAAGGGSMLLWRNGLFTVGPESAGAHPGPACYRKGGPLTITDANLFLGRISPDHFPSIFGPDEDQPLDVEITRDMFQKLTDEINADNASRAGKQPSSSSPFTPVEVALGFLQVASEVMARPIRVLTEARGHDSSTHMLSCFGGAGGQHACDVAKALSITEVVVHKYSSILSAYGLLLADLVHEVHRPAALVFGATHVVDVERALDEMAAEGLAHFVAQGVSADQVRAERYLNMRYSGSSSPFMVRLEDGRAVDEFADLFIERHRREFGFVFEGKSVLVDDYRVRVVASTARQVEKSPHSQLRALNELSCHQAPPEPETTKPICFNAASGYVATPLYALKTIKPGTRIPGPALILDATQTILVDSDAEAIMLDTTVLIRIGERQRQAPPSSPSAAAASCEYETAVSINPVQLSIFGHRFMGIAEQMGRALQRTAVSTNIKERLDFSCAIFSPDGGLVANAPHNPVHLGSMQFCVRHLHKRFDGQLEDGDVLISNHPASGGTHLPDITLVTPVFDIADQQAKIAFYVASRGHHADIGGIRPGSMPPDSRFLYEEGAAILGEKLVSRGVFNEARITELLRDEPPRRMPKGSRCPGTRKLSDNLSDLKAQVAANVQGIVLIGQLIREHGLRTVHAYMQAIQDNAEQAVRVLLRKLQAGHDDGGQGPPLRAVDYMDDGTPICLSVAIDAESGSAIFDFSGTGPQVYGNTNAPRAITHSAVIYALRCLIDMADMPLNQGCLAPVTIRVPEASILSPDEDRSVVGGNVLTSQRLTDVVLRAFGACADSQGCMNNLTFGMGGSGHDDNGPGFGYYETIGGGAGAGPAWQGTDGVHTHMTNTRITDPEVLEKRYPVVLHRFGIRKESGGRGRWRGGDGLVRELEFRVSGVQVSILSERRSRGTNGMLGGGGGQPGQNIWIRSSDGSVMNLGGKASVQVEVGDRIVIKTPGGGAWGEK